MAGRTSEGKCIGARRISKEAGWGTVARTRISGRGVGERAGQAKPVRSEVANVGASAMRERLVPLPREEGRGVGLGNSIRRIAAAASRQKSTEAVVQSGSYAGKGRTRRRGGEGRVRSGRGARVDPEAPVEERLRLSSARREPPRHTRTSQRRVPAWVRRLPDLLGRLFSSGTKRFCRYPSQWLGWRAPSIEDSNGSRAISDRPLSRSSITSEGFLDDRRPSPLHVARWRRLR